MGTDLTAAAAGDLVHPAGVKRELEIVRCVECRHEYELPPLGDEFGCPECGTVSWVSIRIPVEPERPLPRSG